MATVEEASGRYQADAGWLPDNVTCGMFKSERKRKSAAMPRSCSWQFPVEP
jgi:hypothetical protein